MTTTTIKRGEAWAELRPLSPTLGRVKDANVLYRGDLVQAPLGTTWESLSEHGEDGESLGHPGELEILFDAVTGHFAPSWTVRDLGAAMGVADPAAAKAFDDVDERLDLEAFLESIHEGEARAQARASEVPTPRRRKRDVA